MANNSVKVLQNKENQVSTKLLAESIVNISRGMKELVSSGLTDRALYLLLSDHSGETITTCGNVVRALQALETNYVKKKA